MNQPQPRLADLLGAAGLGDLSDQFATTDRREEAGGRINFSVQTKDGVAYRCYMYSATGFQRPGINR